MRSRYVNDSTIKGGTVLQSANAVMRIREGIKTGAITLRVHVVKENERLDHIAGRFYGDGRHWWVIAAASNIGWALQVPAGTRLHIPMDMSQVEAVV